jgi:type I restriction-modification system DNA methylase subunit
MKPTKMMVESINNLIKKYENTPKTIKFDEKKTFEEFIKPLFCFLGWDFSKNSSEVISVNNVSKNKADYIFQIEDIQKFVLKIVPLEENIDDAKWIIPPATYAFNKGITWTIITNFKKIKVLNSEVKGKTPSKMQWFELDYNNFILKDYDRFAYLLKISFERDILDEEGEFFSKKQKKTPVGKQLLEDLLKFSDKLSNNILKNNSTKNLSSEEINEAVHKIMNRLIFMRACGDRGLEQKHLIVNLREWEESKDEKLVRYLRELFDYFEENYGGTIFSHHLCDKLEIDDNILKQVIEGLYISEEKSIQYDFSIIESDVLGAMYEQYLRFLRTEEKEIDIETSFRKDQGIFYTPNFVVDYMIENTLGKLIENKKLNRSKIRILDPACGSGTFLIKAYDFLYANYVKKDKFVQTQISTDIEGGVYSKKVQILKENLFGVDLDKVATEIIQLNLLLKITEKKQHLPILQQNIRHGNSLIENEKYDEFPFKWKEEFHQILNNEKGFDIIIGNPPYVRQEKILPIKSALESNFEVFNGKADLYIYFFERSLKLLKDGGYLAFIVSNKWMKTEYGLNLRTYLKEFFIENIIDFGDTQIFKNATTYPCIIILKKIKKVNREIKACRIDHTNFKPFSKYIDKNSFQINQMELEEPWEIRNPEERKMIKKIRKKATTLENYVGENIHWGIKTGLNKAFVINESKKNELIRQDPKSIEIIKPLLEGKDVHAYSTQFKKKYLIFTRRGVEIEKYPAVKKYLEKFKGKLTPKKNKEEKIGRKPGPYQWYEIQDNIAFYKELEKSKIIYGQFQVRSRFTIDDKGFFVNNANSIITIPDKKLLGILNSKVGWYFIEYFCIPIKGGRQLLWENFKNIPISTKESHLIERWVEKILSLNKNLEENITNQTITNEIKEEIRKIENSIDNEIYKLYDLRPEEIEIIESSIKKTQD